MNFHTKTTVIINYNQVVEAFKMWRNVKLSDFAIISADNSEIVIDNHGVKIKFLKSEIGIERTLGKPALIDFNMKIYNKKGVEIMEKISR